MKLYPTGKEAAKIDEYTQNEIGIPGIVLMEKAAESAKKVIISEMQSRPDGIRKERDRILVAVEGGNNGGDGIALARLLYTEGYNVDIYEIGKISNCTESYNVEKNAAEKTGVPIIDNFDNISYCDYFLIVDAIFGTGLHRTVDGIHKKIVEMINAEHSKGIAVISIDIPTGISADTGKVLGCAINADITVTFGFTKYGMLYGDGKNCSGKIITLPIGLTYDYEQAFAIHVEMEKSDISKFIPDKKFNINKGSSGKVFLIAGSEQIGGAAYFSAAAAYNTGAGMVVVYTSDKNRIFLNERIPEAIIETYGEESIDSDYIYGKVKWSDVTVIGPGIGTGETARKILINVFKSRPEKLIIDADAINLFEKYSDVVETYKKYIMYPYENDLQENKRNVQVVFSPHMAEMLRLEKAFGINETMEKLADNRTERLTSLSIKLKACIVLKDYRTECVGFDKFTNSYGKYIFVNTAGNAGMAKGGSGDVLTGIIAGILAQTGHSGQRHEKIAGFSTGHKNVINCRHKKNDGSRFDIDTEIMPDRFFAECVAAVGIHALAGDITSNIFGMYGMTASDIIKEIPAAIGMCKNIDGRNAEKM